MGILSTIRRWFSDSEKREIFNEVKLYDNIVDRLYEMSEDRNDALSSLPTLVSSLSPGDISSNINYMYIQEIGKHLSPIGNDNLHTIILKRRNKIVSEPVARIECTNSLYSEWLAACCETMWKTEFKVAYDIHGNIYTLGKMTQLDYEIEYSSDK